MQISMIGKGRKKDEDEQAYQNDCQQKIKMPQMYENPEDLCKNVAFDIFLEKMKLQMNAEQLQKRWNDF